MSVRIHQLAKQIGLENKELLELLKSRGFVVRVSPARLIIFQRTRFVEEFAAKHTDPAEAEAEAVSVEEEVPKGPSFPEG